MKAIIEIIERAVSGDQQAYTTIYNLYEPYIRGTIQRMITETDVIEDLIQLTFIKAFEQLSTFKPISIKFWLKTIATNLAIDYIRSKKSGISIEFENDDPLEYRELFTFEKNPEQKVIENESTFYIQKAFSLLRTDYRKVLDYKYNQDLSYAEIAIEMNIPEGTVKSLLHKARKKIHCIYNKLTR